VNNLVRPYREAAHDILWVLDSNISPDPLTLARSVAALTAPPAPGARRQIALVHHVPFAVCDEWALGSAVEAAFLNTNHAKMYVAINVLAVESCVVGKSCLYRRSDLERVSGPPASSASATPVAARGMPAFGRFLAEDNMLAGALWHELGARHALGPDVARNAVGRMRLVDYVRRRVRWIRVRKHMEAAATLVEPLTEAVVLGAILATSLRRLAGVHPAWALFAHGAWWLAVDLDVYASLAGHPVPAGQRFGFLGAWLIREFLALPIWVLAMVGNTVEWRGRQYEIMRNGEVRRATKTNGAVEYENIADA
jgi:ceramide glucosyltransferase